jgi:hypothetical protein
MNRHSLKALAVILLAGSLVAWFVQPSRRVDWIPLWVVGLAVLMISGRIGSIEGRLDKLELPSK